MPIAAQRTTIKRAVGAGPGLWLAPLRNTLLGLLLAFVWFGPRLAYVSGTICIYLSCLTDLQRPFHWPRFSARSIVCRLQSVFGKSGMVSFGHTKISNCSSLCDHCSFADRLAIQLNMSVRPFRPTPPSSSFWPRLYTPLQTFSIEAGTTRLRLWALGSGRPGSSI